MSKLQKYLRKQKIKHLRLTWCDNANVIRAMVFPLDAIDHINQEGVSVSQAIQAVSVVNDQIIPEAKLPATQHITLKPDWLSFHLLPHTEASACVMSRITDHVTPSNLCPRHLLTSMTRKLFEKTGLSLRCAFDQTFQLLDFLEDTLNSTYQASQRSLDSCDLFLTDLIETLTSINIPPNLFQAMTGAHRFKFLFKGVDPLVAADNQILLRQTIHGVAMKYHLNASFLPVLSEGDAGNGSSLQFKLFQNNKNVTFEKEVLSTMTAQFIAGVLYHLPDLMAFTTPTVNSLKRIRPKNGVGCYPVWGYDNREAPIEVPRQPSNDSSRSILFKVIDATANPYYALSGFIAAGLDGIEKKMPLSKPMEYDPALIAKHDSIKALPTELTDILKSVERFPLFRDMMGETLFNAYLAVKKSENEFFKRKTLAEEVALLQSVY